MFPLHILGPVEPEKTYSLWVHLFLHGSFYLFIYLFLCLYLKDIYWMPTLGKAPQEVLSVAQIENAGESTEHGTYLFYQERQNM